MNTAARLRSMTMYDGYDKIAIKTIGDIYFQIYDSIWNKIDTLGIAQKINSEIFILNEKETQ